MHVDNSESSLHEMTDRNNTVPADNPSSSATAAAGAKPPLRFPPRIQSNSMSSVPVTPASFSGPCQTSGPSSQQQQDTSAFERQFLRTLSKVHQTIEKNEFRLAEQDRREAIKHDWQQVALVVDRLLLLIFTVATLGITMSILFHPPHSREFLFGAFFSLDSPGPHPDNASTTAHTDDTTKSPLLATSK